MSRRITAGNDAPFRWAVKLQGKPFDLSGKDVKVYVINSRGEIPVARLTIEGHEVSGVFEGRYQTRLGEHSLVLRVNEGRPEMKTATVANVFELVQWSADAGGSDEGDVIVAPVLIESELSIGGVSYDDTEVKNELARLEREKADKSELTELSAEVGKKQDTITDLETIRSGAEKGATALQSVPDTYATKEYVDQKVGQGGGGGSTTDLTAVAKWGVVTQTLNSVGNANDGYVVQVSNPVKGWIPQSFIDEVTNFGGIATNAIAGYITGKPIFNAETGYFEYQGIVNLAYDEMRAAYVTGRNMFSNGIGNYLYAVQYGGNIQSGVANKLRCILHYPMFNEMGHYKFHKFCQYLNFLERGIYNNDFGKILVIDSGLNISFSGCQTLRECGYFDVTQCKSTPSAFSGNPSLEKIYLSGLKVNINFSASPLLKEECILYMIQKAGATGITITLNPTAYDRAMADSEIVAAMESKQVNLAKA